MGFNNNFSTNSTSSNTGEWNMNMEYLQLLFSIIVEYNAAKMADDYTTMFKCLDCLESTLSPKIDNDDVEKNLLIIEDNIAKMEKRDEHGRLVMYIPGMVAETNRLMRQTYRLLLLKMQQNNLLTRAKVDPKKAMAKMGGT
jgi:hypothetical protein